MFNFEYIGNLHIHSVHSDGGKEIRDIAKKASDAGIDFICINDHSHMQNGLYLEEEGFYDNVVVLVGLEIGKRYHHYLAYGLKEMIDNKNLGPQETIDKVNEQGGFGFLAHPFEKGMPFKEKSVAYTWNDLSVRGFSGICIWNFSSRWKERVKSIVHGLFFLIVKTQTLKGPSKKTLRFWDSLCMDRRVSAIGGSDAHGAEFKWGPIRFVPLTYDSLINSINVHILINGKIYQDFHAAKQDILDALKEGRLFIAHDNLYPAKGFKFCFASDDGSNLVMGEEDMFQPGRLIVELPALGEIRLFRDGCLKKRWRGKKAVYHVTEKGVYRIEVYYKITLFGWRPWIFSNPIYLR